ncbi:unnamed protein product [Camellia sinensis]
MNSLSLEFPVLSYLEKLKGIPSLHIEVPDGRTVDESCTFKWGVTFGEKLEIIYFLCSPRNLHPITTEFDQEIIATSTKAEAIRVSNKLRMFCLRAAAEREALLMLVVRDQPMIESIVITDSGQKKGQSSFAWMVTALSSSRSVCHVPLLRFPGTGYSMDGACLCLLKLPNVHDNDDNGDEEEQEAETEEEEGEEEEEENNHHLDFKAILAAFEEEVKEDNNNNKHYDREAILAAFEERGGCS